MLVEINKGIALLKKDFNIKHLLDLLGEKDHNEEVMHDLDHSMHHLKSKVD